MRSFEVWTPVAGTVNEFTVEEFGTPAAAEKRAAELTAAGQRAWVETAEESYEEDDCTCGSNEQAYCPLHGEDEKFGDEE